MEHNAKRIYTIEENYALCNVEIVGGTENAGRRRIPAGGRTTSVNRLIRE